MSSNTKQRKPLMQAALEKKAREEQTTQNFLPQINYNQTS
jgi:hypothetical protein